MGNKQSAIKLARNNLVSNPNTFSLFIIILTTVAIGTFIVMEAEHIPLIHNKYIGKYIQAIIAIFSILFIAILGLFAHNCLSNNANQDKFLKLQEENQERKLQLESIINNQHTKCCNTISKIESYSNTNLSEVTFCTSSQEKYRSGTT